MQLYQILTINSNNGSSCKKYRVSRGVLNGGVLRNLRKLRVKALPSNLPDFITMDIAPMKI
jgi:hypothetical protein